MDPSASVTIRGVAKTKLAVIRAVQGHADDSPDVAAVPDDGMFASSDAPFSLTLGPLSPGTHTITVEALDEADNEATATTTVTMPGPVSPPSASAGPPAPASKPGPAPPGPAHPGMTWLYDSTIRQWVQVSTSLLPSSLPPLPKKAAGRGRVWLYDVTLGQWLQGS